MIDPTEDAAYGATNNGPMEPANPSPAYLFGAAFRARNEATRARLEDIAAAARVYPHRLFVNSATRPMTTLVGMWGGAVMGSGATYYQLANHRNATAGDLAWTAGMYVFFGGLTAATVASLVVRPIVKSYAETFRAGQPDASAWANPRPRRFMIGALAGAAAGGTGAIIKAAMTQPPKMYRMAETADYAFFSGLTSASVATVTLGLAVGTICALWPTSRKIPGPTP